MPYRLFSISRFDRNTRNLICGNWFKSWNFSMKDASRMTVCISLILVFVASSMSAAPFAKKFKLNLQDGTSIDLFGQGDEFTSVFETPDGYTVIFDPATKTYYYAAKSDDGSTLISSGLEVGKGDPAAIGLDKHLRKSLETTRKEAQERFEKWDKQMEVSKNWKALKAAHLNAGRVPPNGIQMAPPSEPTLGVKKGLCLLIDFDDDVATIPKASIVDFCNGDNFTDYGNNGSVKQFFYNNSDGLLTYTNVVTAYIRIPNSLHPKSYYNNTSINNGTNANLLIKDALNIMKALPNYATEILPTFADLTTDSGGNILCTNVFYAGDNGDTWQYGLWPHSWALSEVGAQELSPNGMKVFRYQLSNIGSSLSIATFCHENGHMLCDFPDLYDYTYNSVGGAGDFCIMGSGEVGVFDKNPAHVCAYLKYAAGWTTTTELTSSSKITASVTVGTGKNHIYRYVKPGVPTEYFLVENRSKSIEAGLPASGIAVWHVDELGDRDNPSLVPNATHANYEVTLVQADNLWHFEHNVNSGDANDLYYAGNSAASYTNVLDDDTSNPNAHWWNGSRSGMVMKNITISGNSMSYYTSNEDPFPDITVKGNGIVIENGAVTVSADNNTDFGTSVVGSLSKTFTIYNTGDLPLYLTSTPKVIIGGANAADFSVTVLPTSPVNAGNSTDFQITITPSAAGIRTATITIANNVTGKNPYTFTVQGQATDPNIEVKGNGVLIENGSVLPSITNNTDFGQVSTDPVSLTHTLTYTYSINNTGGLNLILAALDVNKVVISGANAADFSVAVIPSSPIAGGASTDFQITFTPIDVGNRTATVTIANNVDGMNPYTFTLTGKGINPGVLKFRTKDLIVNEYDTTAKFTVDRIGGIDGTVTVTYSTIDGTAEGGKDFIAKSGVLTWPSGFAAPQTFEITILNDVMAEGTEFFNVELSNATVARLGTDEGDYNVLVTILDNDYSILITNVGPGTTNPSGITYVEAFGKNNITAIPKANSHFINWTSIGLITIADPTKQSTSITYTGDGTVTANFDYNSNTVALTMAAAGDGTVTPVSSTINVNTPTAITATANPGSFFAGWSVLGEAVVQDAESANTNVTIYSDATVTANFITVLPVVVANNVPETPLTDTKGNMKMYKITVPASMTSLMISTSGGTGDCDIYTRFAAAPTLAEYYAKSTGPGTDESITIPDPKAGTWYIMVYAYDDYAGVSLLATYGTDLPGKAEGFAILSSPPVRTDRIRMSWTAVPDSTNYEIWRSDVNDVGLAFKLDTIDAINSIYSDVFTAAGEYHYYYWVRAINAFGAGEFSDYAYGTNTTSGVVVLPNGKAITLISETAGSLKTFKIAPLDALQTLLEVTVSGGTGDCDLNIVKPDGTLIKKSIHSSTNEFVQISGTPLPTGDWFIYLYGVTNYSGVSLMAKFSNITALPAAPKVTATDGTYEDRVIVTWPVVTSATSYEVFRVTDPAVLPDLASPFGVTTDCIFEDSSAEAGTTYYYSARAKNSKGPSLLSKADAGWVSKTPSVPAAVVASDGTYFDKIRLTWKLVPNATSYAIFRSLDPNAAPPVPGVDIPIAETNALFYDDFGSDTLQPPIVFYYWIVPKNTTGFGIISNRDSGYLAKKGPASVSASYGTYSNKITITWPAVIGAVSYDVYRYTDVALLDNDATFTKIAATSVDDPTALYGKPYYYRVKAKYGTGTPIVYKYDSDFSLSSKAGMAYGSYNATATGLVDGTPSDPQEAATPGATKYFSIDVPIGTTRLVATLSGTSSAKNNDCDLFAKFANFPTKSSYTAKGVENATSEIMTVSNPAPGTWYFLLYATTAYSNVTLTANCYAVTDIILTQVPANDLAVPFTATFKGLVVDKDNIGIPNMVVLARNPFTGLTSSLTKTDTKGIFTYTAKITSEGEHTFDFFFNTMPDAAKGTASHTVATRKGCLDSNNFFDYAAYLRATPVAVASQTDVIGLQDFLEIRNGWNASGTITPGDKYETMWIDSTLLKANDDTQLVGKLDNGLYLFFYGVEGVGVGNDTTTTSALSAVPFVVHVASGQMPTVANNLWNRKIIGDSQKTDILSGKTGIIAIVALNSNTAAGDNDYNISLIALEQFDILAKFAAGTQGAVVDGTKYTDVLTRKSTITTDSGRIINVLSTATVK